MARPVVFEPPPPPKPEFGQVGSGTRAFVEMLALFGAFIAIQVAGVLMLREFGIRDLRWVNVAGTLVIGAMLLAAVVLIVRVGRRPLLTIGFRSDFPALDIVLGFGLTFFVLASFFALALLLAIFAPHVYAMLQKTPEAIQEAFPRMHPAWLVAMSAWVAVYEETLFRGFLLTRLNAIVRWWPLSIVLGAAIFALPHFYEGSIAMVLLFGLGTLMGAIFVWRRSLLPVMVLHFLFNSTQLMILYYAFGDWR